MSEFKCKQCGHCCLHLCVSTTGTVGEEDISRWEKEGRFDILRWVNIFNPKSDDRFGDIWIDTKIMDEVNRCPFLRKVRNQNKYRCLIQNTKPWICRQYPEDEEFAKETGCPGFE
jgi:Fe-S-cluster containining protein